MIYQVEDCHALNEGDEGRFTHRLLADVLMHEVLYLKKPSLSEREQKRRDKWLAQMSEGERNLLEERELAEREVHLFRLKEVKRDFLQTIHEWNAEKAKSRDKSEGSAKDGKDKTKGKDPDQVKKGCC